MVESIENQFVWCEKYRPNKIADLILPESTKTVLSGYVAQGRIPNLLFSGGAGQGKTSSAKAMCEEVGCDYILINASSENGIDTLRTKITQFASTTSFSEAKKVVIMDEGDNMSAFLQNSLKAGIEEFSANCSFIFTCNHPRKIIEPIHSRCGIVDFKIQNKDKPALAAAFYKRVVHILNQENIEFDKRVVSEVVAKHFPDFRRCLNELQKYSATGKIDSGILINLGEESFNALLTSLKAKKWLEMRKWVANNPDIDSSQFFRYFYDTAVEKLQPRSLPDMIHLIGTYQYYASQVADPEINHAAFLSELMTSNIEWK